MRLRTLATHCGFGAGLEKELQRQFALHCGMPEVETKLMRSATKMTFQEIITFAISVENSAEIFSRLQGPYDVKSKDGIIHHLEINKY